MVEVNQGLLNFIKKVDPSSFKSSFPNMSVEFELYYGRDGWYVTIEMSLIEGKMPETESVEECAQHFKCPFWIQRLDFKPISPKTFIINFPYGECSGKK